MGQWEHGGGFSVDGSVHIEAADRAGRERPLTGNFRGDLDRLDLADDRLWGPAPHSSPSPIAHCY